MLTQLSKYCISRAITNNEPYYLVKVVHEKTKEIQYDFLNYSFICKRVSYGACLPYPSEFQGDKRGVLVSWRDSKDWRVSEVKKI